MGNNDVKGRGLSQTQEDSIEDCQALCESTEGCVAFMYGGASTVHDSKLCQLSSSATPNNSFGSNFRFCQKLNSGNAPECAILGSEHWSPNQVAPSSAASDAFDCQRQCQDLDSCFFWVFTGQCHLHGADAIFNTNDHTQNNGYITGPKFCDADEIPDAPAASAGKCWIYYHEDSLGPLALFAGNRAGNTWFDGSYGDQTCKERADWWQGQAWHQGLKNSAEENPYPGSSLRQIREDAYAIISMAPAFWETCRWQDASPHEKSGAVTYMGYA